MAEALVKGKAIRIEGGHINMSGLLNAGIVEMNGDRYKMKLIRNVPSATALTGHLR